MKRIITGKVSLSQPVDNKHRYFLIVEVNFEVNGIDSVRTQAVAVNKSVEMNYYLLEFGTKN